MKTDSIHIFLLPRRWHVNPFGGDPSRRHVWRTIRSILQRYIAIPRGKLLVRKTEQGKPVCKGVGAKKIHFNVSHAQGMTILAISEVPVGVDIEHVNEKTLLVPRTRKNAHPFESLCSWVSCEAKSKVDGYGLNSLPQQHPTSVFVVGPYLIGLSLKGKQ